MNPRVRPHLRLVPGTDEREASYRMYPAHARLVKAEPIPARPLTEVRSDLELVADALSTFDGPDAA